MESLRARDPKAIGPYKLVGRLGAGGMGVVYIASKGSETVALKIIRDSIIDDPSQATRFIREIETLKSIDSSYVAKVLDTGTHNERPWFTTEFVNGPDLKSHVTDKGPMPDASWDALAKGLLDGIAAIHAAGVIHRDIKPPNIILSESGPKIIDFGIAQVADATSVTSTGAIAGTPAWFSPEQIEGSEISTATDLFSAGSTLVYAATGKSPWGDVEATTKASVYKILLDEPDLSGLSEEQSRLVRPLLDKNPSERSRVGKPNTDNQQEVIILSAESWFQRLGLLRRSTKLAWSLAIILLATSGGLVLNSFAAPNAGDSLGDPAQQVESEEGTTEPLPAVPLGPDFFDEIASGIELTSAQYDNRITLTLTGPGATYVKEAEVSMSDLPEEWTDGCDSLIKLERVPVGTAYWVGSCELSRPASGETVRASVDWQLTFFDNDGERYVESNAATISVEARPVPQESVPQQRLQVVGTSQWEVADIQRKTVFLVGETIVFCSRGRYAPNFQNMINEGYPGPSWSVVTSGGIITVAQGSIAVGSMDPPRDADLGCREPNYFGQDPTYNASWRVDVSWSSISKYSRPDGSVLLRINTRYGSGEYLVTN